MMRNELQQTQLKLFAGRMQSRLNPSEYDRVAYENKYLKNMVLAEAEILKLQQPNQLGDESQP